MAVTSTPGARTWIERPCSVVADHGERLVDMPHGDIAPIQRGRLLAEALLSERGEAAGAAVARELLTVLRQMTPDEALDLYGFVATSFGPARTSCARPPRLISPKPLPNTPWLSSSPRSRRGRN